MRRLWRRILTLVAYDQLWYLWAVILTNHPIRPWDFPDTIVNVGTGVGRVSR
jgi:hypothetical protein